MTITENERAARIEAAQHGLPHNVETLRLAHFTYGKGTWFHKSWQRVLKPKSAPEDYYPLASPAGQGVHIIGYLVESQADFDGSRIYKTIPVRRGEAIASDVTIGGSDVETHPDLASARRAARKACGY